MIAARRIGVPFIYEVRGLWQLTAATRNSGWEATERYHLDQDLERDVAFHADRVLTITRGVADELEQAGVPVEKISILPNGVDPDAFAPRKRDPRLASELDIHEDDFVLVYVGSLTPYEGLDDLIKAVALLRGRNRQVRAIIVGDGDARSELEATAHRCGMLDSITFVGERPSVQAANYLSLADAVALPRKPFKVCEIVSPLKPFEAMAMEKPVILSDLAALREIINHGETGLLCRPADPAHLADVIEQLITQPTLRASLGCNARGWVAANHSWSANAKRLKELYSELSARTASPAAELSQRTRLQAQYLRG